MIFQSAEMALHDIGLIPNRHLCPEHGDAAKGCPAQRGGIEGMGDAHVVVGMPQGEHFVIRLPVGGGKRQTEQRDIHLRIDRPLPTPHAESIVGRH